MFYKLDEGEGNKYRFKMKVIKLVHKRNERTINKRNKDV